MPGNLSWLWVCRPLHPGGEKGQGGYTQGQTLSASEEGQNQGQDYCSKAAFPEKHVPFLKNTGRIHPSRLSTPSGRS